MNAVQLQDLIERVTKELGMYSESATNLLFGTAAQESNLQYIKQLGNGPALGLFQMEPATERDIWNNYLVYRPKYIETIFQITGRSCPGPYLEWDIAYQIVICRLHYRRVKEALPGHSVVKLGEYWKEYYNTQKGKGTVDEFVENFIKYSEGTLWD